MPVETSRTKLVSLRVPHHIWSSIEREAEKRGTSKTQEMLRRLAVGVPNTRLPARRGHEAVEAAVEGATPTSVKEGVAQARAPEQVAPVRSSGPPRSSAPPAATLCPPRHRKGAELRGVLCSVRGEDPVKSNRDVR